MISDLFGTLGPACSDKELLRRMFAEGMTGMRLNLSHTMLSDNTVLLTDMFEAAEKEGISPKLLIDLRGPEMRIGDLSEEMHLEDGQTICFGEGGIPLDDVIFEAMRPGAELHLDDGKIYAIVREKADTRAVCEVIRGGVLSGRKSIFWEDSGIKMPIITTEDRENISASQKYGVTGVMQPFVKSGSELKEVRAIIKDLTTVDLRVYAKIESREGVLAAGEIADNCDEVVIARGDLGNCMPLWELPRIQKELSQLCAKKGRDFMVVTQMLDSMRESPVPTRAEVSDIYNAVCDGAHSLMVTAETATGRYPVEVIRYMKKTSEA